MQHVDHKEALPPLKTSVQLLKSVYMFSLKGWEVNCLNPSGLICCAVLAMLKIMGPHFNSMVSGMCENHGQLSRYSYTTVMEGT